MPDVDPPEPGEASMTVADPWRYALGAFEADERARRWAADPVAWCGDCVHFGNDGLTPYQADALSELVDAGRLAVRSPHGVGKTTIAALAVLWFALTREAMGRSWKVPTTASVWRQLEKFLWPEIHHWARRLRWDVIGRSPFTKNQLMTLSLKLDHGEAWAQSTSDPAQIEGAHADELLYVFDEAKAIPDSIFDAAEGAFSGAGADTGRVALALATSTPGEPAGRFYQICRRSARFVHWHARRITLGEAVAAGRVSAEWAETMARQWTPQSAVYKRRVLGEFAADAADAVIPLDWVEAANERWHLLEGRVLGQPDDVGIDVARGGDDRSVLVRLTGDVCDWPHDLPAGDGIVTGDACVPYVGTMPAGPRVTVDADGVGAAVYDRLTTYRDLKHRLISFRAGERTDWTDATGQLRFANVRAAAWWHVRDMLNPLWSPTLALPPHDELVGDLTAPRWRHTANDRVLVEEKREIKKRIGRSTDTGDALVMALWGRLIGMQVRAVDPASHEAETITGDLMGVSW